MNIANITQVLRCFGDRLKIGGEELKHLHFHAWNTLQTVICRSGITFIL